MQHSHNGHLALAALASKLSPRTLLGQHFDQQIQGPHGRKQTQQMHAKELGGGVRPMPSARAAVRPTGVDPDVVLDLNPDGLISGKDLQLDYAIENLLKEIAKDPKDLPKQPAIRPRPLQPVN